MIRLINDMPPGTVGLEAVGKVTEEDYRDVLVPAVNAALERGDVRLLYVLGEDFGSYAPGAVWADTKLWARHIKGWKRVAIVSDADWLENSVKAFGWMMPGDIKVFETDDVDDAKEWLVGLDDDDDD
ncbi:STAS/SEC14 domain-containing protein [Mumia sp. Pv 4-285]|uniref:STAS/SEC14 domain-containing protein n=1 Tax=Mumia qirimensis TaxID=3234852 RepID=UPI00351D249E